MSEAQASAKAGVVVIGASGRMGRFAVACIGTSPDLEVVAEIGSEDDLEGSLRAAAAAGARLGLDLTRAGLGRDHGRALLRHGLRIVIGTSGVSAEDCAELDTLARGLDLGGLVVPNFSVGACLQRRLAVQAARLLRSVSIVELHHPQKLDAPSGTAVHAAEDLAQALGVEPGEIPIQSVRIEGLHAEQRILLGAPGELLSIEHRVGERAAYGPGLLASLRFALKARGVLRGLDPVLEEAAP